MLKWTMVRMQQVHGNNVVRVDKNDDGKIIKNCDVLISNDPEVTLSVHVADCLPISVIDKKSRSFGLIHAGWRGLQKQIITNTVRLMIKEFSANPKDLEVTIGPHICQNHYEVKEDVSSKFIEIPGVVFRKDNKEFLDLSKVAEFQLIESGVKKENIKIDKRCTFEHTSLPSFRRNKTSGRLVITLNI
jgi:polyphenol oxidase